MFKRVWAWFLCTLVSPINWRSGRYNLTPLDWSEIRDLLAKNHYVILTRRKGWLTTYLIGFASWLKTGKWGYWSHALMNTEGDVVTRTDFRLQEAISAGCVYAPFEKVFNCDSVALLVPKGFTPEDWTAVCDKLRTVLGKPYDTLFDLSNDQALSCVEMCRCALQASGRDYDMNFPDFEASIEKYGNLTPDMYYNCPDFKVVFEVKREERNGTIVRW